MTSLPNNLYTCEQTRELDRLAIEQLGIPGIHLMKRAARAAFDYACARFEGNRQWLVLCGAGNNAGDGYVFAALARQKGHRACVLFLSEPERLSADAGRAQLYAQQEGVEFAAFSAELASQTLDDYLDEGCVIVDALLGTGSQGEPRSSYAEAIAWANNSECDILALDLPSGLNGDTGHVQGCAIAASATVSFVALKSGLMTGKGPALTGDLHFDDLQLPAELFTQVKPMAYQAQRSLLEESLPARSIDAHKGDFGHAMIIGGDQGYGGAGILAAEAALYSGAGLVSLATQAIHVPAALARRPELMALAIPSGQELKPHLQRPSVVVVGPGLGQSAWSEQMLQQALATTLPLVLDADALNLLAKGRLNLPEGQSRWVLTPHPGEAARLLGCDVEQVQNNRFEAIKDLQKRFGGVVVLKGLGTLIYDGQQLIVAKVGNVGLARGGSGDVLAGLIGSLLAQGMPMFEAAQLAVCVHGAAADMLAEDVGTRGLLAAELVPYIRDCL